MNKEKQILILNLKAEYFYDVKNGIKSFEYRVIKDHWKKKLIDRDYDEIHFKLGYPKKGDMDRTIIVPYKGYEIQTIEHKHFGSKLIEVFAIKTNCDFVIQKLLKGANSFEIPMSNFFIASDDKKYKQDELPEDIDFFVIQGFEHLAANFYSNSKNTAYWYSLPVSLIEARLENKLSYKDTKWLIDNVKVIKENNEYKFRYTIR